MSFPQKVDTLTLKCVTHRFVHCSSSCIASLAALRAAAVLKRDNPTAFAMGFSYLSAAEFIRLFGDPGNL